MQTELLAQLGRSQDSAVFVMGGLRVSVLTPGFFFATVTGCRVHALSNARGDAKMILGPRFLQLFCSVFCCSVRSAGVEIHAGG